MNIKLELPKVMDLRPRLTVVGVGGAGGNAVNNMISSGLSGVNFVVANTDAQSLANSSAENRLQLGASLTEGLGAGARPEIGEAAANEAIEDIRAQIAGSHMVFIAAGMGGGTGTGAASVIARVARECGALAVAVVSKPFQFEGSRRMRAAEAGIAALKPNVDTMIVIPNQNLFRIANEKTTFADAFVLADQVLYSGIACIVDLIVKEGLINLDFADVRTVMSGMGAAMMGTGEASGEHRAVAAAEEAISNPLLDDISLRGAKGLLLSITGGRDLTLYEVDEAASRVRAEVDPEANIIVGATFDDTLGDRIRVSIVASGMERVGESQFQHGQPAHSSSTAAAQVRAEPSPAMSQPSIQPPSVPPASYPGFTPAPEQGGAKPRDDLARALAAAFSSAPEQTETAYSSPTAPATRQTWTSSTGAVFEEASSQPTGADASPAAAPSPYDTHHTHPNANEPFAPQPPAEVRRSARRHPEVEDFPAVGQREYRAKAEQYADRPPAASGSAAQRLPAGYEHGYEHAAPPRAFVKPTAEEQPRKLGFFERLTGAKRRAAEPVGKAPAYPHPSKSADRDHAETVRNGRNGVGNEPSRAPQAGEDRVDLPEFFGKDRKSK